MGISLKHDIAPLVLVIISICVINQKNDGNYHPQYHIYMEENRSCLFLPVRYFFADKDKGKKSHGKYRLIKTVHPDVAVNGHGAERRHKADKKPGKKFRSFNMVSTGIPLAA